MTSRAQLDEQETEIPLNLGMSTQPSAELQEPTSMRLLQNMHWRGQGQLEKRPAHRATHTVAEPSGSEYNEADACGLIVHGDVPAVVTGKHGVMTYSHEQQRAQWTRAGVTVSSSPDATLRYCPVSYEVSRRFVERAQFSADSSGISHIAGAQYNGVQVLVWQETIGSGPSSKLWFKAINPDTGAVVATPEYVALSSPTMSFCKACEYTESGKEGVLIAYVDYVGAPNTVKTIRYDAATNAFVADSDLTTDYSGAFTLTRNASNGSRFFFGYHKDSTGRLVVEDRTISTINSTHTSTTHGADGGIAIVQGASRTLIVSCTAGALGEAYAEVFSHPGDAINPISAGGVTDDVFYDVAVALEERVGTTHDAVMWVQAFGNTTATDATRVRAIEINFDATTPVEGLNTMLPHCQIVTGGFTLHGQAHITLATLTIRNGLSATVPTSCFVARYRSTGTVARHDAVARICHDRYFQHSANGPGTDAFRATGAVYVDGDDNAWLVMPADAPADNLYLPRAQTLFLERVSAVRPMPMPHARPEPGITFVAGGMPWTYDGDVASEATPLIKPLLQVTDTGGGTMTGTFSLIAMFRFTDAAGRLHRIASEPVSTGAITTQNILAHVSTCPMRTYDGAGIADMDVELYITEAGGSTYYLATDGSGEKLLPSSSHDYWYFFEPATAGSTSDVPYPFDTGDGGEISPEPPPAFFHVAKVVDRMWGVDAEDRSRLWYSKPLVTGFGVEWATVNTLVVGDECTAVVAQGGGAVVLARDGVYLVTGEGPNALGVGGFDPAVKIADVDCIDPVSVCRTPIGVVFRGRRGFYLLNGTAVQPFGVPIDPEVLTDPTLDPSSTNSYRMRVVYQEQTNEIHVCGVPSTDYGFGGRLVYNILEQKWSFYRHSGVEERDIAVARGRVWTLNRISSNDVLRDEELFSDVGADYNVDDGTVMRVTTPWLRPAGLGGQFRMWRTWLNLKLDAAPANISAITLTYYVNDTEAVADTQVWTGAELAAGYVSTTSERIVRLPYAPNVQLVHAAKFSVSVEFSGESSGPKLMSLRALYGVRPSKGKRNKLQPKG